jgi:hypothetical protein
MYCGHPVVLDAAHSRTAILLRFHVTLPSTTATGRWRERRRMVRRSQESSAAALRAVGRVAEPDIDERTKRLQPTDERYRIQRAFEAESALVRRAT